MDSPSSSNYLALPRAFRSEESIFTGLSESQDSELAICFKSSKPPLLLINNFKLTLPCVYDKNDNALSCVVMLMLVVQGLVVGVPKTTSIHTPNVCLGLSEAYFRPLCTYLGGRITIVGGVVPI